MNIVSSNKPLTALLCFFSQSLALYAQGPIVRTPTIAPSSNTKIYPWRKNITATIFWIGEKPTPKNPTPNHASSWDTKWQINFGGYDDPKNRAAVGYRPAGFVPKLNPFYIALPYNDRHNHKYIKPEVPKVVPWFNIRNVQKGQSCLKGRWVQIVHGKRYCFAQWEDCGPFNTVDYKYVFGNRRPINKKNGGAGIDLSPSIRDYLGVKSGAKVHWRFVDDAFVPPGPWKRYGTVSKITQLNTQNKHLNDPNNLKKNEVQKYLQELAILRKKAELERAAKLAEFDRKIEAARRQEAAKNR